MAVCTSSLSKNSQKQKQAETLTQINPQIPLIGEQKNSINQFQENQRTIAPRRMLSQNQTITSVQLSDQKNVSSTTMTTKTMIIQFSQIQEQQKTESLLNLTYQRSSIRQRSKTLLVLTSKDCSIVSSKNLENQGKTVMQHNETVNLFKLKYSSFETKSDQYLQKLEEIKLVNMHIIKIRDTLVDHLIKKQIKQCLNVGVSLSKLLECLKLSDKTIGIILYLMIEALVYIHSLGLSLDKLAINSFSVSDDSSTPSIHQLMYPKEAQQYENPLSQNHQNQKQKNKHHEANQIEIMTRNKSNDVWALAVIILQLKNKELPYYVSKIYLFDPEEYLNNHNDRITLQKCLEHPFANKMKQIKPQDMLQPLKIWESARI